METIEASRDFFVMSSDGDEEIGKHADEVIANVETVCRAAQTKLCWTAGDSMEANTCFVEMRERDVMRVRRHDGMTDEGRVRSWAAASLANMRVCGDVGHDYGVKVTVCAEVTDDAITIELLDDEGHAWHGLVITTLEG